jgi:hypothetical protein
VSDVDGGDATHGTVSATGLYTAPATVPSPATVEVCARQASPAVRGCATVTITAQPSAGGDLLVFNDINMFEDGTGGEMPENAVFFRNLVSFTGTGPRASGTEVLMLYRGGPVCYPSECAAHVQPSLRGALTTAGYTIVDQEVGAGGLTAVAASVKLMMLWMPLGAFTDTEVNVIKRFAAEGGRVVLIGENQWYYGEEGFATENQLLVALGAQMTNQGGCLVLGEYAPVVGLHQVFTGVSQIYMACVSSMILGPNDYALLQVGDDVVGALAKIDTSPIEITAVP